MTWWLATPVWGDHYRKVFVERAAASYLGALFWGKVGGAPRVRWIIHTDLPGFADEVLGGYPVEYRQVSPSNPNEEYKRCHLEVINEAQPGDWLSMLNADFLVSINFFHQIDRHFRAGYQAVVTLGMRTIIKEDQRVPFSVDPALLLMWAWANRHEVTEESIWGKGHSPIPTHMFFEDNGSVVARSFQLHPVAMIKREGIAIETSIDGETLIGFSLGTIHVVTEPDDLAFVEMSPFGNKGPFHADTPIDVPRVIDMMNKYYRGAPLYRWQFAHRMVIIRGKAPLSNIDDQVAKAVLYA